MPDSPVSTEPLRRFRQTAVRYALLVTAVGAVAAGFVGTAAVCGFLLGAVAGIGGFWIMAVRIEKLPPVPPEDFNVFALTWSSLRFALYGVTLAIAYALDRASMHGLVAAAIGIVIIRFVLIYLGITRKQTPSRD